MLKSIEMFVLFIKIKLKILSSFLWPYLLSLHAMENSTSQDVELSEYCIQLIEAKHTVNYQIVYLYSTLKPFWFDLWLCVWIHYVFFIWGMKILVFSKVIHFYFIFNFFVIPYKNNYLKNTSFCYSVFLFDQIFIFQCNVL